MCSNAMFSQYSCHNLNVNVVTQFAQVLNEYNETRNYGLCGPKFDKLCHDEIKCRVETDLMKRIVSKECSVPIHEGTTYLFDTYMNEITKMINQGARIIMENIVYDSEMSKLDFYDDKTTCVRYDIVVSENSNTENKFTDIAIIRDGKITAIFQYLGLRTYVKAMKMLLPEIKNVEKLNSVSDFSDQPFLEIDLSKAKEAFSLFQKLASSNFGDISRTSLAMVVALEQADIGGKELTKYAKKIDAANYFCFDDEIPNIIGGKKNAYIHGTREFNYFIDSGETLATWLFCKHHPYANDKGGTYFHHIYALYRPKYNIELPYITKKKGLFGFITGYGKDVVECKYNFAYPFDLNSNLAATQDVNKKWGFIDKTGNTVISHTYDAVNDVFVDGKNFVIKDNHLILINMRGEELCKIYGYNYVIPKLRSNKIIAHNGIKHQFDIYDFNGNLLLDNCFSEENLSKDFESYLFHKRFKKDDINDVYLFSLPIIKGNLKE